MRPQSRTKPDVRVIRKRNFPGRRILGIASCRPPVAVTTGGAKQTVTGTAVNRAGFSATASASINLDKTPPVIGAHPRRPPTLQAGNNSNVTASFPCSDSLSGIASCTAPVTVTIDGNNQKRPSWWTVIWTVSSQMFSRMSAEM